MDSEKDEQHQSRAPVDLFRRVCDEALRDGVMDEFESEVLLVLSKFLGIERSESVEIAKRSVEQAEAGELRVEPDDVYGRILEFLFPHHEADELEKVLLAKLRQLLNVPTQRHLELLRRLGGSVGTVDAPRREATLRCPGPHTRISKQ